MANTIIVPEYDERGILTKSLHKFVYSQKEKEADKFAIVKEFANMVRSQVIDPEFVDRCIENMNIHMGRWNDTTSNSKITIKLPKGDKISFGRDKTRNHPYLDIISQSMATDFKMRPVHISVKDTSKHAMLSRKERTKAIIKEKLKEIFIAPLLEQASMQAEQKYGNPIGLSEEMIQQRNEEINNYVLSNLSDEVKKMIDSDELPSEKLQKAIFDIAYQRNDMAFKYETAVDYMLTTSTVAFRQEFGFNEVYYHPVSPIDLTFGLSYDSIFFEDGLHANVKRYLSPMEIISECYHVFKNKDWKEIEKLFTTIPGTHFLGANVVHQRTSTPVDPRYEIIIPIVDGGIDMATNEYRPYMADGRNGVLWAQNFMKNMNEAYLNRQVGICVDNPTWRWNAKAKLVTRIVGGKKRQFIRGEAYEMDVINGDIEIQDTVIPQTYKAKIIADIIYTEMEPVRGQYLDPFDFSKPKLNIYGAQFLTMDNNVKNLTVFEPGKIYQKKYSEIHESLGESIASNLGSVLFVNQKTFESQGGPAEFFDMLYKLKTVVTKDGSFGDDGKGDVSVQNFSSGIKIQEYITLAQYYEQLMIKALRYTSAKLGSSGQYENQMNIQASLQAPDRQMGRFYSIMLKVMNNINESMAKAAVIAYEKNDELLQNYLPEDLYFHFTENYDQVLGTKFIVKTESSLEEHNNLRQYKELLVNYMATGGNLDNLAEALEAKDMAKAKELGKAATLLREKKEMEQRMHEKQLAELNSNTMKTIEQERQAREDKRKEMDLDVKREVAYLYSMTQANAQDINQDGVPDAQQRDRQKFEFEKEKHQDDLAMKEKALKLQEKQVEANIKNQKNTKK